MQELKPGNRPLRAAEYFELEPAMDYWLTSLHSGATNGVIAQFQDLFRFVYDAGRKQGLKEATEMLQKMVDNS